MDTNKIVKFWLNQTNRDWQATKSLFRAKHYSHALFFCHLTLEKLLKAIIVKQTKKQSSFLHDLLLLVKQTNIQLNKEQIDQLNEISTFNIRARYDDIKYQFYQKATKNYASKYFNITKKLILWLKNYLKE